MNLFKLVKYLRFKPFDVSTEVGRGQERYRLALWSFIANILSKLMALAVMLLSIRWTLPYLGAERFGVWMTVASFTTMLVVLDLGIGNALINHSAHAAAEDNPEKLKKTISGSLGFLFLISVAMGLVLSVFVAILPIEQIIKVKDVGIQPEIHQTLQIFAVLFGFNLFGSGVQKLFSGLQRTFEGFLASALCSGLALICLWWASNHTASIPQLLITVEIKQEYKQLFKSGGLFFMLQIGVMVGWGADSLIISSTLGAASVAVYSITQRLFQLSSMSIGMLHAPLWGAYADANARKDKAFIRITLFRSFKVTAFLSMLGVSILLIFNKQIWLTNDIAIPLAFLCAFGIWSILESMGGALSTFLNGIHIVKPQLMSVLLFIAISLPLKLLLIKDYDILAIPVATIVGYLWTSLVK